MRAARRVVFASARRRRYHSRVIEHGESGELRPHPTGPTTRPSRPLAAAGVPGTTERTRVEALVELLGDESPAVATAARQQLLRRDRTMLAALRRAAHADHARLRARARSVLAEQDQCEVLRRLYRHATRTEVDLESALFLLGRLDTPSLDARPYRKALDAMARKVSDRMLRESDPYAHPMLLPQVLGDELGFIGNEVDFHHPDNIHLHRTIERKRGMPLTLVAIYLFVARRAGLAAAALPLPGHVLLRVYGPRRRGMILDPFGGGRMLTREDCVQYLSQQKLAPRPEWMRDATDAVLFERHVRNLMHSAQLRGLRGLARLSSLCALALVARAAAQDVSSLPPEAEARLVELARASVEDGDLASLTLVVTVGDESVFAGAFGRDDERGRARVDSSYEVTGLFPRLVAALVLDAIHREEIALSDELGDAFDELADSPVAPVTLEQLLTHTGGLLPLGDLLPGAAPWTIERERLLHALAGSALLADPGTCSTVSEVSDVLLGWWVA